jgi:hypothetical protein
VTRSPEILCRQWEILDPNHVVNVCFRQPLLKYSDYSAKLKIFDWNVFSGCSGWWLESSGKSTALLAGA